MYKQAFDPSPEVIRYFAAAMVLPSWLGRRIPMSGNRKITTYSTIMHEQCRQLIAEKKSALEQSGKDRPDILSLLLKAQDLSDEDILNQMLTFLAAGYVVYILITKQIHAKTFNAATKLQVPQQRLPFTFSLPNQIFRKDCGRKSERRFADTAVTN
jgi:uncharacterized membrane protein YccC